VNPHVYLLALGVTLLDCDRAPGVRPDPESAAPTSFATTAAPQAPPFPDYDLGTDLAQRRAKAIADLGTDPAFDLESDVFLLTAPRRDAAFDASTHIARGALAAFFNGRFARHPDRAITVYVFGEHDGYLASCTRRVEARCASDLGFYDPAAREILVDARPGLGSLVHELVHPLVHADFPDAPAWLQEGLASLFERPVFARPGEIHGATNWRHARLRRALSSPAERDAARLDALFEMSDDAFRGADEDLHYATARYACQWLDERGQLWPFYAAWRDGVIDDPRGHAAFARVVGKTPADANAEWSAWVRRL
jgi:hypothetical protein